MQLRARESLFWPRISADILQTAQSGNVCQTFSKSQQRETLMSHEVAQGPWEKLAIDFFEFQSNSYIFYITTAGSQSPGEYVALLPVQQSIS